MDTARLNEFSRRIYDLLADDFPAWLRRFAEEATPQGDFRLRVRAPIAAEAVWLTISTAAGPAAKWRDAAGEVAWSFDRYQARFTGTVLEAFGWLEHAVDELLGERVCIAARMEGGRRHAVTLIDRAQLEGRPVFNRVVGWWRIYRRPAA